MIHRIKQVIWGICVLLLIAGNSEIVSAAQTTTEQTDLSTEAETSISHEQTRTVKVGCSLTTGYHQKDAKGNITGYGYAYEQILAQYAGWNIEYVEGNWIELQEKLKTGEIDLLGFLVENEEREEYYDFATGSSGKSRSCLIARKNDARFNYQDYESFDGMTVACQARNANASAFQEYADTNGFAIKMVNYDTYQDVQEALKKGEVDAALMTNYQELLDYKVVDQLQSVNYHYAVTKGNTQLLTELNAAITAVDAYYVDLPDLLYEKFYGADNGRAVSFTKEEEAYLKEQPVVSVVKSGRNQPFESYNEETGEYEGIVPDVLTRISNLTGITFQYASEDTTDRFSNIEEKNTITSFTSDIAWAKKHDLVITQPFLEAGISVITKNGMEQIEKIAMVNALYFNEIIQKNYPEWEIVYYDNREECIDAVRSGACDGTLLNEYEADYFLKMGRYLTLKEEMLPELHQNICFGISKNSDAYLYSIISKALLMLSEEDYKEIVHTYTSQPSETKVVDLMYTQPRTVMGVGGSILALMFAVIFMLIYMQSIRKKNIQVMAANHAKTEFLSRMSHDMRTPMNGILGVAELSLQEESAEQLRTNMAVVKDSGTYLLSLINDTLDFQRIESGKMKLNMEVVRVGELLQSVIELIRPSVEKKGIVLDVIRKQVEDDLYIDTDPVRVKQIFINLLSNAVKFTPTGGRITLDVWRMGADKDTCHCCVKVIDTGIGMSQEFIDQHLFHPFEQEQSEITSQYAGSGLGLSIVASLVHMMGGRIVVESEKGKGTTFCVYLDFKRVEEGKAEEVQKGADAAKSNTMQVLKGKHILLVEDHPLNAKIATQLLERAGINVTWVENGRAAVDAVCDAKQGTYQAILMDIRMPVMNGLEATRAIRGLNTKEAAEIPIIAMTANAYDEDVKASLDAGMNAHLAKPINSTEMYHVLAEYLKSCTDTDS